MSVEQKEVTVRLPLHEQHARANAKFGEFGEWTVPLYYTSILDEHKKVRTAAGLFDISHMGEFLFEGKMCETFLQKLLCRDVVTMKHGKALYMPLLRETGGIVDDIILYKFNSEKFLMIVNADNAGKDFEWIEQALSNSEHRSEIRFQNLSESMGLLALQGPMSEKILNKALGQSFSQLRYYHFIVWNGGIIARTGYTGEDGFEIMVAVDKLESTWRLLMDSGLEFGLVPAGFGARDTLRLEAGMLLYGHDIDDNTSPIEAGIEWAVDFKKPDFIGRKALVEKKGKYAKSLIGFEMIERGIPRQRCEIYLNDKIEGVVTSGSFSPTLNKNIGLGYLSFVEATPGSEIQIAIRNSRVKAKISKLPFYKREPLSA